MGGIVNQGIKGADLTKHVLHAQANNFYLDPSKVNISMDDKIKAIYDRLPKGGRFEGLSKETKLNAIKSAVKDLDKLGTILDKSPLAANFQEENTPMGPTSHQPAPAGNQPAVSWDENDLLKAKLKLLRDELAATFPPGDPRMDPNYKLDLVRQIVDLEGIYMKNNARDYVAERHIERFKADIDKITQLKKEFLEKFKTQKFYSPEWFNELSKLRETYEETERYWNIKDKMVAIPPYEKQREAIFRGLNEMLDRNLRENGEYLLKLLSEGNIAHLRYHLEQLGVFQKAGDMIAKLDEIKRKILNGEYNNQSELLNDLKDLQETMKSTYDNLKRALEELLKDHAPERRKGDFFEDQYWAVRALNKMVKDFEPHLTRIAGLIDQANKL